MTLDEAKDYALKDAVRRLELIEVYAAKLENDLSQLRKALDK